MKQQNGGRQANHSGRMAEDVIAGILDARRYHYQRQVAVGTSIYGTTLRADFLADDIPGYPGGLIIESKWQDTGGTADEKLPFLVLNIEQRYSHPTIIVLEGEGYRPGAEQWLRGQISGKLVGVYSLKQFMSWMFRLG